MACRLVGAKPLSEPILAPWDRLEFNSWLNSRHPRIQFTCDYSKFSWISLTLQSNLLMVPYKQNYISSQPLLWVISIETQATPPIFSKPYPMVKLFYPQLLRPLLRYHSRSFYPTRIQPWLSTWSTWTSPWHRQTLSFRVICQPTGPTRNRRQWSEQPSWSVFLYPWTS